MINADRLQLYFGHYKTPPFRYGKTVRGEFRIRGITDAPISCPIGQQGLLKTMATDDALARTSSVCSRWPIRRAP